MLKIIDSFNVPNRGIIVIVQHFENGIPPESILYEENNPEIEWKIKSRVFNGTLFVENKEVYFENETQFTHISPTFSKGKKREEALSKLIMERKNNIFEYMFFSKKDNSKPKKDTILILKNKNA